MLRFANANSKLKKLYKVYRLRKYTRGQKVYSFDLLSGWSCPYAHDCRSKAVMIDGRRRIQDSDSTRFRCFSASQEAQYDDVYNHRKHNFEQLRGLTEDEIVELIMASIPADAGIVRIHVAGDYFSERYFRAWLRVAQLRPEIIFYSYTKSITYWVRNRDLVESVPNFRLTASFGGRLDYLIVEHNLRSATVVFSVAEAKQLGLPIDHDDSHAALTGGSFALLIHGTQPPGSAAGKAVRALAGVGSYRP
jgi:hypothetical protein